MAAFIGIVVAVVGAGWWWAILLFVAGNKREFLCRALPGCLPLTGTLMGSWAATEPKHLATHTSDLRSASVYCLVGGFLALVWLSDCLAKRVERSVCLWMSALFTGSVASTTGLLSLTGTSLLMRGVFVILLIGTVVLVVTAAILTAVDSNNNPQAPNPA